MELLTVQQAAQRLGTSVRFVWRLRAERRIAVVKLGKHVRIDSDDLDAYINAGRQEPGRRSRPLGKSPTGIMARLGVGGRWHGSAVPAIVGPTHPFFRVGVIHAINWHWTPRQIVRQAANGTWYLVVDIGVGADREQTRRRGFPSQKAAQAELTRILGSLEQRTYVAPQRQTLADFLTQTWLPAVEHTIKPGTFESYRRNVRLHIAGRPIGRRLLQEVDPTQLNALYGALLAGDGAHRALSPRSVAYIAAILHRAFRDAVRWQAVVRNPADAADPPRAARRNDLATWSGAQLHTFLDSVDKDRLRVCWWLLATTGMRRGEVLGLRWADVDLDAGTLRVVRTLITTDVQRKGAPGMAWGTPKTAKGRRIVALDPATVAATSSAPHAPAGRTVALRRGLRRPGPGGLRSRRDADPSEGHQLPVR